MRRTRRPDRPQHAHHVRHRRLEHRRPRQRASTAARRYRYPLHRQPRHRPLPARPHRRPVARNLQPPERGATFNFTSATSTPHAQRRCLNTGVDPSWAVGKNDAGNGFLSNATTTQINSNPAGITFSNNRRSSQLRPTLFVKLAGPSAPSASPTAISAVTATAANAPTSRPRLPGFRQRHFPLRPGQPRQYHQRLLRDLAERNLRHPQEPRRIQRRQRHLGLPRPTPRPESSATRSAPSPSTAPPSLRCQPRKYSHRINNPGDTLLAQSFIPEQYMIVSKPIDGIANTSNNTQYVWRFRPQPPPPLRFPASPATSPPPTPPPPAPARSTAKFSGSTYAASAQGNITITSSNYLFGNFNQTGTRDLKRRRIRPRRPQGLQHRSPPRLRPARPIQHQPPTTTNTITYTGAGRLLHIADFKGERHRYGRHPLPGRTFDGKDSSSTSPNRRPLRMPPGAGFANGTLTVCLRAPPSATSSATASSAKTPRLDYIQSHTTAGDSRPRSLASQNSHQRSQRPQCIQQVRRQQRRPRQRGRKADALVVDTLLGKDFTNFNDQLGVSLKDANGNQQSRSSTPSSPMATPTVLQERPQPHHQRP